MRADILAKMHGKTDGILSELISVQQVEGENAYIAGGWSNDPPVEILAYVTETAHIGRTSGNNANSGHNIELRGATHTAKFETSALAFTAKRGDEVAFLDPKRNGVKFRVAATMPFSCDRTILLLAPA